MATFLATLKQRSLTVLPKPKPDGHGPHQPVSDITSHLSCHIHHGSQILQLHMVLPKPKPDSLRHLFSAATFITVLKSCSFTWFCPSQSACVSLSPEVFMNPVSSQFARGCQLEEFHVTPNMFSNGMVPSPRPLFHSCMAQIFIYRNG